MSESWLSKEEVGFDAALAQNIQATKDKILSEEKTLSHVPKYRWTYIVRNPPRESETATLGGCYYSREDAFGSIDLLETAQCTPVTTTTFDARVIDGEDRQLLLSLLQEHYIDLTDHEERLAIAQTEALHIESPTK